MKEKEKGISQRKKNSLNLPNKKEKRKYSVSIKTLGAYYQVTPKLPQT